MGCAKNLPYSEKFVGKKKSDLAEYWVVVERADRQIADMKADMKDRKRT
jgi:hypothetical protein